MDDVVKRTIESYDAIAERYCKRTMIPEVREFEHQLLDRFLAMIDAERPRILDIGCGDGRDTAYLREKGAGVIGIDLSEGMLAVARREHPECTFLKMDMRRLEFPDRSFHGVWASGCIYHLPKRELPQAFREVRRILKPGGIFSFNFKRGEGEGMEEEPKSFGGYPRYFAYYSVEEIERLLNQTGFKLELVRDYPWEVFGDRIVHLWARVKGDEMSLDPRFDELQRCLNGKDDDHAQGDPDRRRRAVGR